MKNLENGTNHIENLIHRYLSGTINSQEKDELFRWLVKDAGNVTYFNQISDIWLSSSVLHDPQDFNTDEAFNRVKSKIEYLNTAINPTEVKVKRLSWLKVAAILIPAILFGSLATRLWLTPKAPKTGNPYLFEVPYGSKATVSLPDGSKVILNAGSKLTCREDFGKTNRNLDLSGEGYFSVAKNKAIPFVVHAGDLSVRALGTEFNVKAYPEDEKIEALLIHGSIEINKTVKQTKNDKPVVLMPRQSLVYHKTSNHFQLTIPKEENLAEKNITPTDTHSVSIVKSTVDPTIYASWKEESWSIYRVTLADLAVELERKYDVRIRFGNESLKKITFTGTLPDVSLEQVLAAIRLTSPIEYKIKGKKVELTEEKNLIQAYKHYYRNTTE